MSRFDAAIEALVAATGWPPPAARPGGGVRFELEGGPDLEIFSPDDRRLFFSARLAALAPGEDPEEKAAGLAKAAAAAAKRRAAILSFDGRSFNLHLALDLKEAGPERIAESCQALLNDWDWWPKMTPGEAGPPPGLPGLWLKP
ncbi:MAG: CesT family type III secretion system chaperone [Candidatus Adiutrix sp.]|nr:CesT family type III secretion system chaperone [Candidatus Adiutrix sp.]